MDRGWRKGNNTNPANWKQGVFRVHLIRLGVAAFREGICFP